MEDSNNKGGQSRFLLAVVLSLVVLAGWTYFFAPKPPATDQANANSNANTATVAQQQPTPAPAAQPSAQPQQPVASTPDTTPNRTITVRTPLYEVKLDSRGALATSWIILKSKSPREERPVFADGSTAGNEKPLQLISQAALDRQPRELPFRLATDDQNVNNLINDRNYTISEP